MNVEQLRKSNSLMSEYEVFKKSISDLLEIEDESIKFDLQLSGKDGKLRRLNLDISVALFTQMLEEKAASIRDELEGYGVEVPELRDKLAEDESVSSNRGIE